MRFDLNHLNLLILQDYLTSSQNGIPWIKIGDVASDAKFIERIELKLINQILLYKKYKDLVPKFVERYGDYRVGFILGRTIRCTYR